LAGARVLSSTEDEVAALPCDNRVSSAAPAAWATTRLSAPTMVAAAVTATILGEILTGAFLRANRKTD
jgi:hypothetical protein